MAVRTTIQLDLRVFDRKVQELRANQELAGRDVIVEMMTIAVDSLLQLSSTFSDTNRYYNGWATAGNQIEINRPLRSLKKPKRYGDIVNRLRRQHDVSRSIFRFWSNRVSGMEKRNGFNRWKSYRQAKKKLSKAVDVFDRAIENLDNFQETKGTGAISFGNKKGFDSLKLSNLDRVIFRAYGGSGRIFQLGSQWFGELRNAEPHGKLVEKKHRPIARTRALLRQIGGRNASRKYLESLTQGVDIRRVA